MKVALALLLPALGIGAAISVDAQAIQRAMYVSVVNDAGAPVPGLGPSDFIVREDNVAREVLQVAPADDPMQVAILVDNSAATEEATVELRQAVTRFVTAMTAADEGARKNEVAIITIGERPTIVTPYSTDRGVLLKGANRIFSQRDTGAYLLDGLIEVSQGLIKRRASRPVIVAISAEDGPEFSERAAESVLRPVQEAGASFHAIVLGQPAGGLSRTQRERGIVLDRGTRASGGRYDNVLTAMALPKKLDDVANELLHQYRVTYARPQTLIPPERVTVETKRPGLTARGTVVKEDRERP